MESTGFKLAVMAATGVFVGVSVANVIYYERLRARAKTNRSINTIISHADATSMLVFNSIILVIASILFIWSFWRLLFAAELRRDVEQATVNFFTNENAGFRLATKAA